MNDFRSVVQSGVPEETVYEQHSLLSEETVDEQNSLLSEETVDEQHSLLPEVTVLEQHSLPSEGRVHEQDSLLYEEPIHEQHNLLQERSLTSDKIVQFELQSTLQSKKLKRKDPIRPCLFCGINQSHLRRHLLLKHPEELKQSSTLPKKEMTSAMATVRKDGILKYNKDQMKLENPDYVKERKSTKDSDLVLCGMCSGFFAKSYFYRHKKVCSPESAALPKSIPASVFKLLKDNVNQEFREKILSKFLNDDVGRLCQSDPTIMLVGERLYDRVKSKKDKEIGGKKSVRTDMRRIGHLYMRFKSKLPNGKVSRCAADMLIRSNFQLFRESVDDYCSKEDTMKPGLKYSLKNLIKNMCDIVKGSYLISNEDSKAAEIDKFLDVLHLFRHTIFGPATYLLNRNRQENLRRPEQLPDEGDVSQLKNYTVTRMCAILDGVGSVWTPSEYAEIRDLVVSRLTLFNARRGGEPARLLLSQWRDAKNDVWYNKARHTDYTELEKKSFQDMKLAYQTGKGNHLVPILIPQDTMRAMDILGNIEIRNAATVQHESQYMFPCTQDSDGHVSGWHATKRVCVSANIQYPNRLSARSMRHRVSTLYAGLEVPEHERPFFFSHLGHSANINATIYQTPLAEAEILYVAPRLVGMDGGSTDIVHVQNTVQTESHHLCPQSDSEGHTAEQSMSLEIETQSNNAVPESRRLVEKPLKGNNSFLMHLHFLISLFS